MKKLIYFIAITVCIVNYGYGQSLALGYANFNKAKLSSVDSLFKEKNIKKRIMKEYSRYEGYTEGEFNYDTNTFIMNINNGLASKTVGENTFTGPFTYEFVYDNKNRTIQSTVKYKKNSDYNQTNTFTYKDNKLIESVTYGKENKIIAKTNYYYANGLIKTAVNYANYFKLQKDSLVFSYNNKNQLISYNSYDIDKKLAKTAAYKYDLDGNCISILIEDANGDTANFETYNYDKNKNITKEVNVTYPDKTKKTTAHIYNGKNLFMSVTNYSVDNSTNTDVYTYENGLLSEKKTIADKSYTRTVFTYE